MLRCRISPVQLFFQSNSILICVLRSVLAPQPLLNRSDFSPQNLEPEQHRLDSDLRPAITHSKARPLHWFRSLVSEQRTSQLSSVQCSHKAFQPCPAPARSFSASLFFAAFAAFAALQLTNLLTPCPRSNPTADTASPASSQSHPKPSSTSTCPNNPTKCPQMKPRQRWHQRCLLIRPPRC